MTDFDRMVDSRLPMSWGTIWVGWQGPSQHPSVISSSEVVSYATDQLVRGAKDDHQRYFVDLASTDAWDTDNVGRALHALASLEGFDPDIETLKWEVVLLTKLLQGLSSDPVDALMNLTHFWSLFDYPASCPHTIQGVGNDMTPQEYYTPESLARIVEDHRAWLQARESELTG